MVAARRWAWWVVGSVAITTGAVWLAVIAWNMSNLAGRPYAPHAVAAFVAALTIAGVTDRRPLVLAMIGALGSVALYDGLWYEHWERAPWPEIAGPIWLHYVGLTLLSSAAAVAGVKLRRRSSRGGPSMWLWISSLVTLGGAGTVMLSLPYTSGTAVRAVGIFGAAMAASGMCQVLAPYRMIWACGGGAAIFALIAADTSWRRGDASPLFAAALLALTVTLIGALGARIAWRLFRNDDPRTREAAELPAAQTRT